MGDEGAAPTGQAMEGYVPAKNGLPDRVLLGKQPKDAKDGYTSNFADIMRQAKRTPGPGKYVVHPDWTDPSKKAMGKYLSEPSYSWGKGNWVKTASFVPKDLKYPGPGKYQVRPADIMKNRAPNQPRVLQGGFSKKPKTWALGVSSNNVPGPGKYDCKYPGDPSGPAAPKMAESAKKTVGRALNKKDPPGPGAFTPGWTLLEPRQLGAAFGRNKAVQKRYTDIVAASKKWLPDPGTYPQITLEKYSRGAKWSQVNGVASGAHHGTY